MTLNLIKQTANIVACSKQWTRHNIKATNITARILPQQILQHCCGACSEICLYCHLQQNVCR